MARQQAQPVTPERSPSSVISEPATIEACRRDYAAGAAAREAMAKQAARARRS
ncbi:hypothetical protein ACWCQM_06975 [Streptomyces sp. NPDC002125]